MVSGHVKIYSVENTPRLRYIAGIILGDILGLEWEVITDRRKSGKQPVINYSNHNLTGSFRIIPDPLLFETGICPKEIQVSEWKGLPVFFQDGAGSDLPFDIFAASFFLLTRYEEYLKFAADAHGRFPASSSLSFRHGFLHKPVIDLWAKELAKALLKKIPSLVFRRNEYQALLTIDTDEISSISERNIFRSIEGLFQGKNSNQKISTEKDKDPYEVFDYILEEIEKDGTDTRFFFPVGDRSEYDKNPSWKNEQYRKLIQKIACKHKIGLHLSYFAAKDGRMIKTEAARINSLTGGAVSPGRYHYLRLSMPLSYSNIISAGINEDYSMGYHDEPGFRSGIARPYYFYNIAEEKLTALLIVPFQIMDITFSEYKKLDPDRTKSIILSLINETRKVGGLFVSIWHNTSLLDNDVHKKWKEVFEYMMKTQKS